MSNNKELLIDCCLDSGYDSIEEMLDHSRTNTIVPAYCKNCGAVSESEQDQDMGYCEDCCTNSVVSVLVLAGLV